LTTRRIRWIEPIAIGAYLVLTTWNQQVGNAGGPPFRVALPLVTALIVAIAATRVRVGPLLVSVALVCAASVLTDVGYVLNIGFTDLGIYLTAGHHLIDGHPVYQLTPLTAMPADYTTLPYLYPPPTIAFFALLAALPANLGGFVFVAGSVAMLVGGLRRLGLSWGWSILLLLWPPILNGIMSGNVAIAAFALFALGPIFGIGLVVAPLFKPYNAIGTLWLLRERRVRAFAAGALIVAVICLVTLPFVGGPRAWLDWADALATYIQSERNVRQLYGIGLERFFVPAVAILAIGAIFTILALRVPGPPGLARLGVATIVAQPTLYIHGFMVALPALLDLRARWFWLAAAALAVTGSRILPRSLEWPGPWIAVGVVLASWALPAMRRVPDEPDEPYHPLGGIGEPWRGMDRMPAAATEKETGSTYPAATGRVASRAP
jgi:hypothetical protein